MSQMTPMTPMDMNCLPWSEVLGCTFGSRNGFHRNATAAILGPRRNAYYLLLDKLCETDSLACFTSLTLIVVLVNTRSGPEMKLVDYLPSMN